MEAQIHPLDIESLNPGDVISVEQIEEITQSKSGTTAYSYAVQGLRSRIEKERRRIGRPITARQLRGALVICTPSDQLRVAGNRSKEAARKLRKTHTILIETRVEGLTEDEMKAHERLLLSTGAKMAVTSKSSIRRIIAGSTGGDEFAAVREKLMAKGKRAPCQLQPASDV